MEARQNSASIGSEDPFDISQFLNLSNNENQGSGYTDFAEQNDTSQAHAAFSGKQKSESLARNSCEVGEEQIEKETTDRQMKRYGRKSNQNRHKKCQTLANRTLRKIGLKKHLPFLKKYEGKYYYTLTIFLLVKYGGKLCEFKKIYGELVEKYKNDLKKKYPQIEEISRIRIQSEIQSLDSSLLIVEIMEKGEIYDAVLRLYNQNLKRSSLIDSAYDSLKSLERQLKDKFAKKKSDPKN